MTLTPTEVMYIVGVVLLAVGEGIALARGTDREEPLTHYIRGLRRFKPAGFLALLVVWVWLGYHFLIDFDGSLPF